MKADKKGRVKNSVMQVVVKGERGRPVSEGIYNEHWSRRGWGQISWRGGGRTCTPHYRPSTPQPHPSATCSPPPRPTLSMYGSETPDGLRNFPGVFLGIIQLFSFKLPPEIKCLLEMSCQKSMPQICITASTVMFYSLKLEQVMVRRWH